MATDKDLFVNRLAKRWANSKRWRGIVRSYSPQDVDRLRGTINVCYTLAEITARKLWHSLNNEDFLKALGALTGNQAIQMAQAGLKAIYLSGWQVAADANDAGQVYPDQSLYPADSVPNRVRVLNNALRRADQISCARGDSAKAVDWMVPIVADAEAGFGGPLNAFEIMKAMIEAGAAGVHFEDQLASAKKCGHMGGKVLVPTSQFIQTLIAARFAADIMGVPTVLIARTDANGAKLITSDIDDRDKPFLTGERTSEGFYVMKGGLTAAIARALAYAPYADMLWCETSTPNLEEARIFADEVLERYPGKLLMYNCSPSFNWKKNLSVEKIANFQDELGKMGYRFQFITLAGFHLINYYTFVLAMNYGSLGMPAYVDLQEKEFGSEKGGYTAVKHQEFVGTGYFDEVLKVISGGATSIAALKGSTEKDQFSK